MRLIFLLVISLLSSAALAFPEMIRHNYVNCTACHFAPAGGGLLTPYGRTISSEVLSTWGSESEARPFYGALDTETLNSFLQVGGDVRALQFHHENGKVSEGQTIPMQAGLEFVAFWKKWTAEIFVGKLDKDWKVEPVGTRYYLMYQFFDELTVRVGKFLPVFGLNIPQHTVVTRGSLGFNHSTERYAIETMWSGEQWNFTLTNSQSVPGAGEIENAHSVQMNYAFNDSYRVGASYWLGYGSTQQRQIMGVHAALGFTEHLYVLTELDYQSKETKGKPNTSTAGVYQFAKIGYEIFKGFHLQAVEEFSQTNVDNSKTRVESFGPGFLFYPRPHFELEALYTKKKIAVVSQDYEDYAYLMGHYYF